MQTSMALTALFMGVAGGPHCVAMCGAACAGISRAAGERSTQALWTFQFSRMLGYGLFGAFAAGSVQGLAWLGTNTAVIRPVWTMFHVGALLLGAVMSSIPAVVALLSWLFLRERIGWRSLGGIACAAIGITLFSLQKVDSATALVGDTTGPWGMSRAMLGNLLVLAAVVCEAAYVVIGKRLTEGVGPKRISAIINLWGFALVTPMGLWAAWRFDFGAVASPIWGLLVFYALAASMWTVWLWMTGLKRVPASQAGVFTVMLPISAATIGVIFMGERLSGLQMLAFAIALFGLVLATLPARRVRPLAST